MTTTAELKIFVSVLVANIQIQDSEALVLLLANHPDAIAIAQGFGSSKLIRQLKLIKDNTVNLALLNLDPQQENQVFYQNQLIGQKEILYKTPLPGELQSRLAIESITDRFLEYLQKVHHIVVLNESDRHVQVFIPNQPIEDFKTLWDNFLRDVAFSANGNTVFQLPGLVQTFIIMLNAITLSDRGFSTLSVPIITQEQSNILAALYFAIIEDVKNRQQRGIDRLKKQLTSSTLSDKERTSKEIELQSRQEKKESEAKRYTEYFSAAFNKFLNEQNYVQQELKAVNQKLEQVELKAIQKTKLYQKRDNIKSQVILRQQSIEQKNILLKQAEGNPFEFIKLDIKQNTDRFKTVIFLSKLFNENAVDQINSSVRATFTKCICEMYRLLENEPNEPLPQPILTRQPVLPEMRSPGDDHKEFCYSCGTKIDPKTANWQVLRFMFERPSQRRQSASSEGRPYICASCSALAFASPLKVTDESIILRLEPVDKNTASELKVKDYIRMMTNKELHLSAGRYIVLASERTNKGDFAAKKLGQVQYALAKVASIFPLEVFGDFKFSLIIQGSQPIHLVSRHLIFIKGLIESYNQSIVISDKEINMALGEAIRYVEKDLPYLAEYTLIKTANTSKPIEIEQVRETYYKTIENDKGDLMNLDSQLSKRAKLYGDVAALTGLTYAFAHSLENTAKKAMKLEDAEREVSKLIEKVDDAVAFCYYATLGDENKTSVEARLWKNSDNYFVYEQTQNLLAQLEISGREEKDEAGKTWLKLYADDVLKAYTYFAKNGYPQDKDWKDLTYQLKLSLYTRFPELVRKLKSTSEK